MTREEALETLIDNAENGFVDIEEVKVVFSELEQKPCEDAISRKAALDTIGNIPTYNDGMVFEALSHAQRDVALLPPVAPQQKYEDVAKAFQIGLAIGFGEKHDEMDKVIDEIKKVITPQPKTGHWVHNKCDVCEASRPPLFDNYCPNCGCRMVEPQESEDKE